MENGEGDEKSRKDVNGIVEMGHQHYGAEENGSGDEEPAKIFFIPKDQGHQERQAGVPGKEQVVPGGENAEKAGSGYLVMDGERADVGQGDENRADDRE